MNKQQQQEKAVTTRNGDEGEGTPIEVPETTHQLAPQGMHPARLVWVADIGTHHNPFGDGKKQRKVILFWELPNEKAVFDMDRGPEPFLVHKIYTMLLSDRTNLYRDLTAWLGKHVIERVRHNLALLIGEGCLLNVIHETNKKGQLHANVISLAPLPKATRVPAQITPSLRYSIKHGVGGAFADLPEWVQKMICASEEIGGARPSVAEVTERNVRRATANAIAGQDESAAADGIFNLDAYSDEDFRKPEVVNQIRKIIEGLPCSNADKINQYRYLNDLVRRAKANVPALTSDEVADIDELNAKLSAEVNGGELE
jgi:hypothetical protein